VAPHGSALLGGPRLSEGGEGGTMGDGIAIQNVRVAALAPLFISACAAREANRIRCRRRATWYSFCHPNECRRGALGRARKACLAACATNGLPAACVRLRNRARSTMCLLRPRRGADARRAVRSAALARSANGMVRPCSFLSACRLARGAKDKEHAMPEKFNATIAVIDIDIGKNSSRRIWLRACGSTR
jgi:hypothetical protein